MNFLYRTLSNVLNSRSIGYEALYPISTMSHSLWMQLVCYKSQLRLKSLYSCCRRSMWWFNSQWAGQTSVSFVNFDGSSANVTLFSSRKIFLFWNVFGWLRKSC